MHGIPPELNLAFERFEAIQAAHFHVSMEKTGLGGFARANFERNQAFEELKQHLNAFLKSLDLDQTNDRPNAGICLERIAAILEKDQALTAALTGRRLQLSEQLKQLRRGRQALAGYGSSGRNGAPFFVSNKE